MENNELGAEEFVGGWEKRIRDAWQGLPEHSKNDLLRTLNLLPGDRKGWERLMDSAREHFRVAAGRRRNIAILGPVNVGKSTLYNQLIQSSEPESEVSSVPGTTRSPQSGEGGLFYIIDTPGADASGSMGEAERQSALMAAQDADVIVLMFDASHGIREPQRELYQEILRFNKPMVVALNKVDLVKKEKAEVIGKAAATLGIETNQVIPMSARRGEGVTRVLLAAAKSEPEIIASLGAALPAYRWDLTQLTVGRASSTAAAIALTPLPFVHFIPLLGIQSAMVLGIARIYNQKVTMARARELVAAFGVGLLGRMLFYELIKIGGPPAWAVSAAVAAGTTAAMGYAIAVWFDEGKRISNESLKTISRSVSASLINRLKNLGRRKPDEASLREIVIDSLEKEAPTEREIESYLGQPGDPEAGQT
jgi:GTP-binding protein Era